MKMRKLVALMMAVLMLCSIIPFSVAAESASATITFDSVSKRTEFDSSHQVWQENGITVTNNKGASTSAVADYAAPARFYKSSTLIVEYLGMTKIEFACNTAAYATALQGAIANATVEGKVVSVTLNGVDSFSCDLTGGQVRMDAITVYGEGGAPVDPPVEPDEPEIPDVPETPDEPETPVEPADSAVLDLTDKANRVSYSSSQQVWKQNGIVVTNDKGASTTNVGDYANPGRFYKSSTVTIEYPGMTKIFIDSVTYDDNDYAIGWTDSFSGDATAVAVDGDVTIVFASPVDSFVWEKLTTQSRAYTITVYTGEAGDLPEVPDEPEIPDTPAIPDGTELTIADAIAMGQTYAHNTFSTAKYYVTGVITEVYNDMYGNMKVSDEAGNILTIYGTWSEDGKIRYDALENAPVAGDTVVLYGIIGQYNGTSQMKNGWIMGIVGGDTPDTPDTPAIPDGTELTIADAIAMGQTFAHNTFSSEKYYVTGVITEVYNDMYGNMKVSDEAGNILTIYGTWSEDGKIRYDALENAPVAGDTVVLYGIIGQYNGTSQMKNGWIMSVNGGDIPDTPDTPDVPDVPVDPPVSDEIETDYPYLFGMTQYNVSEEDVYFLAGGMDGYYLATTTNPDEAIVVYLEATNGGYYFYTYEGNQKLYINMVVKVDGEKTHVNGAYESAPSTVYTYDAGYNTLIAEVNGDDYWFATRNDKQYTTMGPCKVSYEGFYGEFYYFTEDGECEHEYESEVIDPTCGEDGATLYVCSLCGDYYEEPIPATGAHTYDDELDADCNVCGAVREVPDAPVEYAGSIVVSTVRGRVGDQVQVTVTLPNNPGIVSARLRVYFDTKVLKYVGHQVGDFTEGGYSFSDPAVTNDKGYFVINWCDVLHPDVTVELLATLTFEILDGAEVGTYPITLDFTCDGDMFNAADETVWLEAVNGGVNVIDTMPGDADGNGKVNNRDLGALQKYLNGTEVTIDLSAMDLDGNGKVNNRDLGLLQKMLNQ